MNCSNNRHESWQQNTLVPLMQTVPIDPWTRILYIPTPHGSRKRSAFLMQIDFCPTV